MTTTIKTVGTYTNFAGPGVTVRRFRIEDARGYCEFAVADDNPRLLSFGGSLWPPSFPDHFKHVGPDAGMITARSGYELTEAMRAQLETAAADPNVSPYLQQPLRSEAEVMAARAAKESP